MEYFVKRRVGFADAFAEALSSLFVKDSSYSTLYFNPSWNWSTLTECIGRLERLSGVIKLYFVGRIFNAAGACAGNGFWESFLGSNAGFEFLQLFLSRGGALASRMWGSWLQFFPPRQIPQMATV